MFSVKKYLYIGILCGVSMLHAGCSISYSLEKSSDSVSTSLDSLTSLTSISTSLSSSSSSSGESEDTKVNATGSIYEEDVAAVTVLYVSREKTTDDYQRQVAAIAKNHGISDWEQEESTFFGMGRGLRRAGISESSIVNLPFFRAIAGGSHYADVITGYKM